MSASFATQSAMSSPTRSTSGTALSSYSTLLADIGAYDRMATNPVIANAVEKPITSTKSIRSKLFTRSTRPETRETALNAHGSRTDDFTAYDRAIAIAFGTTPSSAKPTSARTTSKTSKARRAERPTALNTYGQKLNEIGSYDRAVARSNTSAIPTSAAPPAFEAIPFDADATSLFSFDSTTELDTLPAYYKEDAIRIVTSSTETLTKARRSFFKVKCGPAEPWPPAPRVDQRPKA